METVKAIRALLGARNFSGLRSCAAGLDAERLASIWREFDPVEKLVIFKLLAPRRALAFYSRLDLNAKYFLLCAFDLNSIAPVLEGLPKRARGLFQRLPASYYDRMLQLLARDQVEIEVSVRTN